MVFDDRPEYDLGSVEMKPQILRAPNIYDIARDDLPRNVKDSELLLDAEVLQKLQIIEGEKN